MARKAKPKRPVGAPAMPYDKELGDIICERLADGESLRKICQPEQGFPSRPTFFKWLADNEAFANQYRDAREAQADALFDETLDIADETKEDYILRLNHNGPLAGWEVNGEAIARSKLRIDARRWMASKLRPKKYSDQIKVDQTVSVSADLGSLLERIATGGQRLTQSDDDKE